MDTPDFIVVGSGAGGAAVTYKLVTAGHKVVLIEKGGELPRDGSTLDVKRVFRDGAFKNTAQWVNAHNQLFVPGEFYNVGGKTKWYGAALLRFAPHEFSGDRDHQCLAWPFGYDEISPFYDEAESLLHVNRFDNEPELQVLIDTIKHGKGGWRAESLPLGLKREILNDENEAKHFDGFASACGYKSDAQWNLIDRVQGWPNFDLVTNTEVTGFVHDGKPTNVSGVICADGSRYLAPTTILAAGAMTTPRIVQDHARANWLGRQLPNTALIGANFKMHINSALLGFSAFKKQDVLRKTAIFFNDRFPHSTVQCLGWLDGEILATQLPAAVPRFVVDAAGARAYGFFVTTEDGSSQENRIVSCGGAAVPLMDYDLGRLGPAAEEHHGAVAAFHHELLRTGMVGVDKYMGLAGTAHALGSMVAGDDAETSVVDASGRVHGFDNLYIADGSVLPRSSRVNPALTIYAWGLRLGHHLARNNHTN